MKKIITMTLILLTFISCGKKEEDEEKTDPPVLSSWGMTCLRWVDRFVYFGNPVGGSTDNNPFNVTVIENLIKNIEVNTKLGEDYFRMSKKNSELLQPIRPSNLSRDSYDSFILIWDDNKFNNFVNTELGGFSNIPDRNAITITHTLHKRKFYMIFRASCFAGELGFNCGQIGPAGLNALIARQLGHLFQIPPANCNLEPNNVMCSTPKNEQWNAQNRTKFYEDLTSQLINIKNNSNFYSDRTHAETCLDKKWMDREIYPASPDMGKNNTFFMQDVFESLDEISCSSMLGCSYFIKPEQTIAEKDIPIFLERVDLEARSKSYLMIWDDLNFNSFIADNDFSPADPNSIVFVNKAYKRNYSLIMRASCFEANNPYCDSGNSGITKSGLNALVARQLGLMVGLSPKDCSKEPHHVMCTESPSDFQWTDVQKERFFNQFNNALEYIGNNKNFYHEYLLEIDTE